MISIPIDIKTGGPVGPVTYLFEERGQSTRSGKERPRSNRVSGVLYLGRERFGRNRSIEHLALLVFNPKRSVDVASLLAGLLHGGIL